MKELGITEQALAENAADVASLLLEKEFHSTFLPAIGKCMRCQVWTVAEVNDYDKITIDIIFNGSSGKVEFVKYFECPNCKNRVFFE